MKLLYISSAIILSVCSLAVQAQDPFYSQAHRAPLSLNPALAGEGQTQAFRAQSNLRSQWWGGSVQPYKTGSASLEHKISTGEHNAITLAAGFQSETSNGGVLKNNFLSAGAAYHLAVDAAGKHTVSVGLLGTYANRMIDLMKATTQSQFGSFGFMRGTTAYDPIVNRTNRYFDVQTGVGYSFAGERVSYHLGGALYHAARPRETAYGGDGYRLARRSVVEANFGYVNDEGGKWSVRANAQSQASHQVQQFAVDYRLPIGGDKDAAALTFGLGMRPRDSYFPYVGLEWQGFAAGLSYDRVTGSIHRYYNQVNSAELTLAYSFGKKK
jgi:type IX secretion system PorP/SprF family membrane protein